MEINPNQAIEFIIANSKNFAIAKSNRVFLEEYRKTKKAELMKVAEIDGHKSAALQEREAYANPYYKSHLEALQEAVAEEERLRWLLIAAQARIECWKASTFANAKIDKLVL